jgi:hypothetical protein
VTPEIAQPMDSKVLEVGKATRSRFNGNVVANVLIEVPLLFRENHDFWGGSQGKGYNFGDQCGHMVFKLLVWLNQCNGFNRNSNWTTLTKRKVIEMIHRNAGSVTRGHREGRIALHVQSSYVSCWAQTICYKAYTLFAPIKWQACQ